MPFDLSKFIEQLETISLDAEPSERSTKLTALLASACSRPDEVLAVLIRLEDFPLEGGALILRQSDNLFLSVFVLIPGQRTAIHDHGMDTAVGVLQGSAISTVYERFPSGEVNAEEPREALERTPGEVYFLHGKQPHDECNTCDGLTIQLHLYPGNVLQPEVSKKRNLWGWDNTRYTYTHDKFFKLAAERSSAEIKENIKKSEEDLSSTEQKDESPISMPSLDGK